MSQESWLGLARSFTSVFLKSFNQLVSQGWDLTCSSKERIHFQVHRAVGRIHFLAGFLNEGLSSLLIARERLPLMPSTWDSPYGSLLHQSQQGIESSESMSKTEITILSNIITKVTSYHLCHILLFGGKLQMLPHSRGDEYTRTWTPGGGGHWKSSQTLAK